MPDLVEPFLRTIFSSQIFPGSENAFGQESAQGEDSDQADNPVDASFS
jgi:hypothetical protein